jgi:hypothetical protein
VAVEVRSAVRIGLYWLVKRRRRQFSHRSMRIGFRTFVLAGNAPAGIALAGIALARIALARIALIASRVVTHRCILPILSFGFGIRKGKIPADDSAGCAQGPRGGSDYCRNEAPSNRFLGSRPYLSLTSAGQNARHLAGTNGIKDRGRPEASWNVSRSPLAIQDGSPRASLPWPQRRLENHQPQKRSPAH